MKWTTVCCGEQKECSKALIQITACPKCGNKGYWTEDTLSRTAEQRGHHAVNDIDSLFNEGDLQITFDGKKLNLDEKERLFDALKRAIPPSEK
ncbi:MULTISPECIES: hypothetical protein [unclassified Paenibacillus]|uniref:hypothetical protein n=1 Tax=unclassified Paenibacillus TaxID=185978 RepID=UPI00020D7BA0|nr:MULTISPECIES: hypothetical protein [unclassified Paenibacillus]EGL18555.1 hypothetical protein HMPREF9413_5906 [Paenibacillus sp. HGF7]EPD80538.1 hypothetical protein HMPREF1207_05644 [Paenibacillus sp. HGH0039]